MLTYTHPHDGKHIYRTETRYLKSNENKWVSERRNEAVIIMCLAGECEGTKRGEATFCLTVPHFTLEHRAFGMSLVFPLILGLKTKPPVHRWQRQAEFSEFEDSLVHIVSPRPTGAASEIL